MESFRKVVLAAQQKTPNLNALRRHIQEHILFSYIAILGQFLCKCWENSLFKHNNLPLAAKIMFNFPNEEFFCKVSCLVFI